MATAILVSFPLPFPFHVFLVHVIRSHQEIHIVQRTCPIDAIVLKCIFLWFRVHNYSTIMDYGPFSAWNNLYSKAGPSVIGPVQLDRFIDHHVADFRNCGSRLYVESDNGVFCAEVLDDCVLC